MAPPCHCAQDRELLAGRTALLAAQRAAGDKSATASILKQELWQAKAAIAKQAALLDAVAHDIFNVRRVTAGVVAISFSVAAAVSAAVVVCSRHPLRRCCHACDHQSLGIQVLQQPDERRPGGKTARQLALEALGLKYCTSRGGGARSSVQVTHAHVHACTPSATDACAKLVLRRLHGVVHCSCRWRLSWQRKLLRQRGRASRWSTRCSR